MIRRCGGTEIALKGGKRERVEDDPSLLQRLGRDLVSDMEWRDGEIEKLRLIIKQLQRYQFGRRSEKLAPDQLALGFEDLDADIGRAEERRSDPPAETLNMAPEKGGARRQLPEDLPRQDITHDVAETAVYARDDRPWSGPDPPAALCLFSPDRKSERPASHLDGFRGTLRVDGYAGFERLTENGRVTLAARWAHTRRKFYELAEATGSPIATEALARIAALYQVEADIRGFSADERKAMSPTHAHA